MSPFGVFFYCTVQNDFVVVDSWASKLRPLGASTGQNLNLILDLDFKSKYTILSLDKPRKCGRCILSYNSLFRGELQ